MQEALALNRGGDLCAEAGRHRRLVSNQKPAGFLNRVHDRFLVPGKQRLQIDQFGAYVQLFLRHSTNLSQDVNLSSVGEQCDVVALFDNLRLRQRYFVFLERNVLHGQSVQYLRLEEYAGVLVLDACGRGDW